MASFSAQLILGAKSINTNQSQKLTQLCAHAEVNASVLYHYVFIIYSDYSISKLILLANDHLISRLNKPVNKYIKYIIY